MESAGGIAEFLRSASIWKIGASAGLIGGIAATVVAGIAVALDVPVATPQRGDDTPTDIALPGFFAAALFATAIATAFAALLQKKAASSGAKIFAAVTVGLTLLSFLAPATAPDTDNATRVTLALSHVAVALVVLPALWQRLRVSTDS